MVEPPVKSRARFQFELRHLLYATVLLAASLGLFGVWGIVAAVLVLLFWAYESSRLRKAEADAEQALIDVENIIADEETPPSQSDSPGRSAFTLVELLVVITIIAVLLVVFLPASSRVPWSCWSGLRRVSSALHVYHNTHGSMPPTYVADAAGKPAHSWRVLILPELGRQDLYDEYRFDEPWNSPHNLKLLNETPGEYQCNDFGTGFGKPFRVEPGMTTCLAVTGKGAAWPNAAPPTSEERGHSSDWTALVVEVDFQPVPWTKPEDFSIEDAARLVDPPDSIDVGHWERNFFWSTYQGRHTISTHGRVGLLPPCEAAHMRELLTGDDGKPDEESAYLRVERPDAWRRIHYTNIARFAFFLFAIALPELWMRPRIQRLRKLRDKRLNDPQFKDYPPPRRRPDCF